MHSSFRKWNSKQLNVGVLSETFWLPEFPKVMDKLEQSLSLGKYYFTLNYITKHSL